MPIIATGKAAMQASIKQAFITAKDSGAQDGADPDAIISQLSADIASAVDAYVTSITVLINPGTPVVTAGSPSAQAGATVAPGSS